MSRTNQIWRLERRLWYFWIWSPYESCQRSFVIHKFGIAPDQWISSHGGHAHCMIHTRLSLLPVYPVSVPRATDNQSHYQDGKARSRRPRVSSLDYPRHINIKSSAWERVRVRVEIFLLCGVIGHGHGQKMGNGARNCRGFSRGRWSAMFLSVPSWVLLTVYDDWMTQLIYPGFGRVE